MKKILVTGTFDILHPGHLSLFKQARNYGDYLVALIARDQNVEKHKDQKPFFNELERFARLQRVSLVDQVVLGDLNDPYKAIHQLLPEVIALGYDQQVYVNGLNSLLVSHNLKFKIVRLEPFQEEFFKSSKLRQAVASQAAKVILIDKPADWTSHDVVAKMRNILKTKRIGHTGTLDPFATGLLICLTDKATTLTNLFNLLPKTYLATIKLGLVSDTYDRTGKVETKSNHFNYSENLIKEALAGFNGKIQQLPPMFSAKKIKGQRLYQLARQGKEVERKLQTVEIYDLKLLSWQNPFLKIEVSCSSGTYIRSLAHDLGQKLDSGAVLWELKRTAIGDFSLAEANDLTKLKSDSTEKFISPLSAIEKINEHFLSHLTNS